MAQSAGLCTVAVQCTVPSGLQETSTWSIDRSQPPQGDGTTVGVSVGTGVFVAAMVGARVFVFTGVFVGLGVLVDVLVSVFGGGRVGEDVLVAV